MIDPDRRRLLGDFVRAHRESLAPEITSTAVAVRGLRREELAAKAGISATWCAWIEQGRDVQVSAHALGRLAQALALSRAERAYLFDSPIAAIRTRPRRPRSPTPRPRCRPPSRRWLIPPTALTGCGTPAAGTRRLASVRRLADQGCQRNLLRFVFVEPAARKLIRDWQDRARRLLAEFRADYSRGLNDPRLRDLVDGLRRDSASSTQNGTRRACSAVKADCAASRIPRPARSSSRSTATRQSNGRIQIRAAGAAKRKRRRS